MLNLIKNPGLENGDNGDWSFFSGCTLPGGNIIAEPANARSGNYRMMVRAGKSGPGTQTCGRWSQIVPIAPGEKYRVGGYYKVPTFHPAIGAHFMITSFVDFVIMAATSVYLPMGPFDIQAGPGDTSLELIALASPPLTNPGFFNFYFDDFFVQQLTFPNQGRPGFVAG